MTDRRRRGRGRTYPHHGELDPFDGSLALRGDPPPLRPFSGDMRLETKGSKDPLEDLTPMAKGGTSYGRKGRASDDVVPPTGDKINYSELEEELAPFKPSGSARDELGDPSMPEMYGEDDVEWSEDEPDPYGNKTKGFKFAKLFNLILKAKGKENDLDSVLAYEKSEIERSRADREKRRQERKLAQPIGGELGQLLQTNPEMSREDLMFATSQGANAFRKIDRAEEAEGSQYTRDRGDTLSDASRDRDWDLSDAEAKRQHELELQRLRNRGRSRSGGDDTPRLSSEERAQLDETIRELYGRYASGQTATVPLELQDAMAQRYGRKGAKDRMVAARQDHGSSKRESRKARDEYGKIERSASLAQVSLSSLQDAVRKAGDGYGELLREIVGPDARSGGGVSAQAAAIRSALISTIGGMASMKGGTALTNSEMRGLGGGGIAELVQQTNNDPKSLAQNWLSASRNAITPAEVVQFIQRAPAILEEFKRSAVAAYPQGNAVRWRAGDRRQSATSVARGFVRDNPGIVGPDSDVEVIGPEPGSDVHWIIEVDGEEHVYRVGE